MAFPARMLRENQACALKHTSFRGLFGGSQAGPRSRKIWREIGMFDSGKNWSQSQLKHDYKLQSKKVLAFLFQPASTFENIIDRTSINSAEMLFLMPTLPRGERLLRADLWSLRMHWANCVRRSDELKLKQHDIGWSY